MLPPVTDYRVNDGLINIPADSAAVTFINGFSIERGSVLDAPVRGNIIPQSLGVVEDGDGRLTHAVFTATDGDTVSADYATTGNDIQMLLRSDVAHVAGNVERAEYDPLEQNDWQFRYTAINSSHLVTDQTGVYDDGRTWNNDYDAAGRIDAHREFDTAGWLDNLSVYDDAERRDARWDYDDANRLDTYNVYDDAGRVDFRQQHDDNNHLDYQWTFDDANRVDGFWIHDAAGRIDYVLNYDDAGRLDDQWVYDDGNRPDTHYTFDDAGRTDSLTTFDDASRVDTIWTHDDLSRSGRTIRTGGTIDRRSTPDVALLS